MDAFTATPLCPSPIELELDRIVFDEQELVVIARARRRVVACPVCRHASTRVHSRYQRTLLDLPWHGLRVRLQSRVRRFFCDQPGCSRHIFTERLPRTAAPYARRTARAMSTLETIALALGGRAGARLAQALGIRGSPSAVRAALTRSAARAADAKEPSAPRFLAAQVARAVSRRYLYSITGFAYTAGHTFLKACCNAATGSPDGANPWSEFLFKVYDGFPLCR